VPHFNSEMFNEYQYISVFEGEFGRILENMETITSDRTLTVVLVSGVSSFTLNITSFWANKVCSASLIL
jgi:hypothetical protein